MAAGVSFLVPVYNKAPYLAETLAAIRAQQGDFEREYVFVDDGSTDDSLDALRQLTAGWPNVTIHGQPNGGSAAATNRCIALARHDYAKFVDADDLLHRDATRLLLAALAPSDACLVWGDFTTFRSGAPPDTAAPLASIPAEAVGDPLRAVMRNALFNPTQILVRTAALRAVGGCDERVRHSQEYGLALRLAARGAFLHLPLLLAFQRTGMDDSLSANRPRQLQRVTQALGHFVADHPELAPALRRFAVSRAAGRAALYARRHRGGAGWVWYKLRAFLPVRDAAGFIADCAAAFD
jgi:glycosyltransferase involved in cell wall biosynthesis